jgi:catalase
MPLSSDERLNDLSRRTIAMFDRAAGGIHAGFRPAHAKGLLLTGEFVPAADARSLTRAAHVQRPSTPVSVRLSNFAGIPTIPDNAPDGAGPRGCAIRFHLAEHEHTDIVAHSTDAFPARTVEEFLEFLAAVLATDPAGPHPNAIERYLGEHPAALAFVQAPKPIPRSFANESFYAVSAFAFTDASGGRRHGRYRILPVAGSGYLAAASAAQQTANFLFDEIAARVGREPVRYRIVVQLAEPGDVVDDATVRWPETRTLVPFGEIALTAVAPDNASAQRRIIFDPIPRIDGIEATGDPLFEPRANVYLMSGRRRRAG